MFDIKIIIEKVLLSELQTMSQEFSEQLVKAVVDVKQKRMAIHAAMHVDEEALLLQNGSEQKDLWGINIHPFLPKEQWIEYDSMINLRAWQGNRSRGVEDPKIREVITGIVHSLIQP